MSSELLSAYARPGSYGNGVQRMSSPTRMPPGLMRPPQAARVREDGLVVVAAVDVGPIQLNIIKFSQRVGGPGAVEQLHVEGSPA